MPRQTGKEEHHLIRRGEFEIVLTNYSYYLRIRSKLPRTGVLSSVNKGAQ